MRDKENVGPMEALAHITIDYKPGADFESVRVNVEKMAGEIKQKYLGTDNTAESRKEMHKELGDSLGNIPGVESVHIPQILAGNLPTIIRHTVIDLETGEITIDEEIIEGDPVKRPLWSRKVMEGDNPHPQNPISISRGSEPGFQRLDPDDEGEEDGGE